MARTPSNAPDHSSQWLTDRVNGEERALIERKGFTLTCEKILAVVGSPINGRTAKAIAEYLPPEACEDGKTATLIFNIGIDKGPAFVLDHALRAMVHAITGRKERDQEYRDVMSGLGYEVRNGLRNAEMRPDLKAEIETIAASAPPLVHSAVNLAKWKQERTQTTRNLKAECHVVGDDGSCGFRFRISRAQADRAGTLICPVCQGEMTVYDADGLKIRGPGVTRDPPAEAAE